MAASEAEGAWRLLGPWSSPAAVTRWLDRTDWWAGSGATRTPQRMLVEILEAVAGRFAGKQLTVEVRGRQLSLTLGQVRVDAAESADRRDPFTWWMDLPGSREMLRWTSSLTGVPVEQPGASDEGERVIIESRDVTIDDQPVGDVAARVDDVRLEYGPITELVTGPVELDVHTSRSTVVAWVERVQPEWHVQLHGQDLLAVDQPNWPVTMLVRPEVIESRRVRFDVVGVLLFGRQFMLPRRFVRSRLFDIPDPSEDIELLDVSVDGDDVRVRLRHPGIRQPVRPEHIRNAVREGVARLTAAAFP